MVTLYMTNNKHFPRVLICSNYGWTLFNFRLPLIRFLQKSGFEVHLLAQEDDYSDRLRKEVTSLKALFISRKGINPLIDIFTVLDMLLKFFITKPDIILLYTIKPVIYGSIAAGWLGIPVVNTITGLGTAFVKDNWLTRIVEKLYKVALRSHVTVVFQNGDDQQLFIKRGLVGGNQTDCVPGSGIDLKRFSPLTYPSNESPIFLLVARLLRDKGIGEYVAAARSVKVKYPNVRFQILGPLGVINRSAISREQVDEWVVEGVIEYLGETDDVIPYIQAADCVVLPSYREGISRTLLEASASARPIVTTDTVGCKDVVNDGATGLLCRVSDSEDLAAKLLLMINMPREDRARMGMMGRKKVEQEFSQEIVFDRYLRIIKDKCNGI